MFKTFLFVFSLCDSFQLTNDIFSFLFTEFRCQFSEQFNAANIGNYCRLFDFRAISHSIFVAVPVEVSTFFHFSFFFAALEWKI